MYYPKLKVIFPHIAKTGGSTLEYFLGQLEHPEIYEKYKNVPRKMTFLNVLYKMYQLEPPEQRWRIHRFAKQYLHSLGEEEYDSCYSFAIIRNPFAQIRSLYKMDHWDHLRRGKEHPGWEEFIFSKTKPSFKSSMGFLHQKNLVSKGDEIIVNELFPFEYYKDVVNKIGRKFGFKPDFSIRMWDTKSMSKEKYEYTPEMIERVLEHFTCCFDLWKRVKLHWEKTGTPYAGRKKSRRSYTGANEFAES